MKQNLLFFAFSSIFALSAISQTSIALVKDIKTIGGSSPHGFFEFNNKLLFTATDDLNGSQIWSTDGTEAGTELFKVINPSGTDPFNQILFNSGFLFFTNLDTVTQLWITDGTDNNTQLLKEFIPHWPVFGLTEINGKVVFKGFDIIHGSGLWVTDGTAIGTQLLKDIDTVTQASYEPNKFLNVNGKVVFHARTSAGINEPWVTDGTFNGTHSLRNPLTDNRFAYYPSKYRAFNGKAYFGTFSSVYNAQLWVTDGTPAGTDSLKSITPGEVKAYGELNGKLIFADNLGSGGFELWETDGTSIGTQRIALITNYGDGVLTDFVELNNELYFTFDDGIHGEELWKTDGTATGTVLVKDIVAGVGNSEPRGLTSYRGKIYFSVNYQNGHTAFYETDGTEAGTININPPTTFTTKPISVGFSMYNFEGELYFSGHFDDKGFELRKIVNPDFLSVSENKKLVNFDVFPNPTNDVLTIISNSKTNFTLYDLTGKALKYIEVNQTKEISISDLDAGIYILKENHNESQIKIVKQ